MARRTERERILLDLIAAVDEAIDILGTVGKDIATGHFWTDSEGNEVRYYLDEYLASVVNAARMVVTE
jgi:hypothetical protein